MKAYAIFLALTLTGCATKGAVVDAQPVDPPKRTPPAEAMLECQKPQSLEDGSFGAVVRKLSELAGLFEECKSKHDELRDFLNRS